jgi:ATP-dependent Clp protease adaptor protein ClpS
VRVSIAPVRAPQNVTVSLPDTIEAPVEETKVVPDRPWTVIVWNDPVNLMSYVVLVLQKVFGYSREKATRLMLEVHQDGKSAVAHGTREKCEGDVSRLHAHGLWATMERDGS